MLQKYGRLLGIAALVAGILWVVGLGFWRFSVTSSISALEPAAKPMPDGMSENIVAEVLEDFKENGDRALPFIAEALEPGSNPSYLAALSRHFLERVRRVVPGIDPDDLRIVPSDSMQEIERKCTELRVLWTRLEPRYRWWMWWTDEGLE